MPFMKILFFFLLLSLAFSARLNRIASHDVQKRCATPFFDPVHGIAPFYNRCVEGATRSYARFSTMRTPYACPACPNGFVEIGLKIASTPDGWRDRYFALNDASVTGFYSSQKSHIPGNPSNLIDGTPLLFNGPIKRVANGREMLDAIKHVGSATRIENLVPKCYKIRYLTISVHGSPGFLYFPSGSITARSASLFNGLDCVFAPNAYIATDGCNVAEGCRGEDIMMMIVGKLLKTNGGKFRAFTGAGVALGGLTFGLIGSISIDANTQILTVGANLANPSWDDTPRTPAQCVSELNEAKAQLQTVLTRLTRCRHVPQESIRPARLAPYLANQITAIESAIAVFDNAVVFENGRTSRTDFTDANFLMADLYHSNMAYVQAITTTPGWKDLEC